MKRLLNVMGVVVLAMSGTAAQGQNGGKFVPPKLVSAGEIAYPVNSNSGVRRVGMLQSNASAPSRAQWHPQRRGA